MWSAHDACKPYGKRAVDAEVQERGEVREVHWELGYVHVGGAMDAEVLDGVGR